MAFRRGYLELYDELTGLGLEDNMDADTRRTIEMRGPGAVLSFEEQMEIARAGEERQRKAAKDARDAEALKERTAWKHQHGLTGNCSKGLPIAFLDRLNALKHECLTDQKWARFRLLVNQAVQTVHINNVISLGLSSICSDIKDKHCCETWIQELALFLTTVDIINTMQASHSDSVRMIFQDPVFKNLDKNILTRLGACIVTTPEAGDLISENTFLFALHCHNDVFEEFCFGDQAVLVGNVASLMMDASLHTLNYQGQRDPTQLGKVRLAEANTKRDYANFLKEHTSESLPEVEITGLAGHILSRFFYLTNFYTKRKENELEVETCHACRKTASLHGPSLMECGSCHKTHYCSKACQKADWKRHKILCGFDTIVKRSLDKMREEHRKEVAEKEVTSQSKLVDRTRTKEKS